MKRLEALRLELDSRRRTVTDLQGRCERVRANLGTTRARGEADMELTLRKMQHKEDKMQRTASRVVAAWLDGAPASSARSPGHVSPLLSSFPCTACPALPPFPPLTSWYPSAMLACPRPPPAPLSALPFSLH